MRAALVIMAAGMGSRYGGNKQVDGIGPNGEILMEYSIFDALRAGLRRWSSSSSPTCAIDGEHGRTSPCRAQNGGRGQCRGLLCVSGFFERANFYKVPSERVKPFGTVHALLCAREFVHEPFVVINAETITAWTRSRDLRRALKARRKRRGHDGRL